MSIHGNPSSTSLSSIRSEPPTRSELTLSPLSHRSSLSVYTKRRPSNAVPQNQNSNIDYLSFGTDPLANYGLNNNGGRSQVSTADWERLLSSLDNGQTNIYDTIYGGAPADALAECPPLSAGAETNLSWSPGVWNWGNFADQAPPQSVLSFTDESLASGEEFGACGDFAATGNDRMYPGIMIPDMNAQSNGIGLDGMGGNFGM
jgi:hypothetical protein